MAFAVSRRRPAHVLREADRLDIVQGRARKPRAPLWRDEMMDAAMLDSGSHAVTDGEIAVVNLENARRRSWHRLVADPMAAGVAERVVEQEQKACEFLGDVDALERLDGLATQLGQLDPRSARTALVQV